MSTSDIVSMPGPLLIESAILRFIRMDQMMKASPRR
jgi:hypothetical protein